MKKKDKILTTDKDRLYSGVLWLNSGALGLSLGLLCGLAIFIATNWLVLKGGDPVGSHLRLLGQFFIGYEVSFPGSLIGFVYGFAVGTLSGASIGWIYNKFVEFRN